MKGYVILELDLPDEVDAAQPTPFDDVLTGVNAALTETQIARVTRIHAAVGDIGLAESVEFLRGR